MSPDRSRPLVLTSLDGQAATLAALTLQDLEYRGVRALDGGTRAWDAAGLDMERGATALRDVTDDVVLKPYEKGREAMEAYLRWEEDLDMEGRSPNALLTRAPA